MPAVATLVERDHSSALFLADRSTAYAAPSLGPSDGSSEFRATIRPIVTVDRGQQSLVLAAAL